MLWRYASEAMQAGAARGVGVRDRPLEVVAKALLAPGQAGGAVLAALRIAGRRVVQHHLHARLARRRADVLGLERVGILVLHRAEARAPRGREALEERQLLEQRRNVRRQSRHRVSIA